MGVSRTATLVERCGVKIETELQTNPLILADWGNLLQKAQINRVDEKRLTNGSIWMGKGCGAQIRGWHPDSGHGGTVVVDDLEDPEESQNPEIRTKDEDWFNSDLMGTLETPGNSAALYVVGTIVHQQSILANLAKDDTEKTKGWVKRRYDAEVGKDGDVLWPEHMSREKLEAKKAEMMTGKRGVALYYQEYRNIAVASETMTIKPEWIQYYDKLPVRLSELYKVIAIDPAYSEKRKADFTAVVCVGVVTAGDDKFKTYILDSARGHWATNKDKAEVVMKMHERFRADKIIVEANVAQITMYHDLKTEAVKRGFYGVSVEPVKAKPKEDKLTRLQDVANLFQDKYIYFRKEDSWIADEVLLLPEGTHDDGCDALVWALRTIKSGILVRMTRKRAPVVDVSYINEVSGY